LGDNTADVIPSDGDKTAAPADEGVLNAGVVAGAAGTVGVLTLLVGTWVWWRCRRQDPPGPDPSADLSFELPERKTGDGKSFLPGAACALGGCVLTGTFLSTMGGFALEGLLATAEAVPFVGEVCQLLLKLKQHVDDFHDAEEECRRLSVWCVAMMGSFSRLAKETPVVDDAMKGLLQAAGTAVKELYELVMARHEREGVAALVFAFWTTGGYLDTAKLVKERVQKALEAFMLRSTPEPHPSTFQPSTLDLRPPPINLSTLDPRPLPLAPPPLTLNFPIATLTPYP
jgi:hypothetical protein